MNEAGTSPATTEALGAVPPDPRGESRGAILLLNYVESLGRRCLREAPVGAGEDNG